MVDLELLASQLSRIGRRWPELLSRLEAARSSAPELSWVEGRHGTLAMAGVQLSSRHDPWQEARLQAELFGDSRSVVVYGTGLGALPRVLLSSSQRERLSIKILNPSLFVSILALVDQREWLEDERVELSLARDDEELQAPWFVIPPELVLAEDDAWKIRDRLQLELNARHIASRHAPDDPELLARIADTRLLFEGDRDVAELFGSAAGRAAYVFASGPSLEDHLERLAAQLRGKDESPLLIAVDTAHRTLVRAGIHPHITVTMDRYLTSERVCPIEDESTSLVYFPLTDKGIVQAWRGPRFTAYSKIPLYERLMVELPRGLLWSGGSVLHAAVDLAVLMGVQRVSLFGADFAFVGGKTHAGWESGELGKDLLLAEHWVKNVAGEKVRSSPNFAGYLSELERYIFARPHVAFYTTSSRGALIARTTPDPEYYV